MKYKHPYLAMLSFAVWLAAVGLIVGDPTTVFSGLHVICTSPAALIVDYIELVGPAAAFVNAALVTLISILYMYFVGNEVNGFTFVILGLMSGFALFGKNIFNMLPILLGGYLYAKLKKVDPKVTCNGALMVCCMGPVVSFVAFGSTRPSIPLSIITGIVIGLVIPPFAARTAPFQQGLNYYNTGFACGLLAIFFNALFLAMGETPETNSVWCSAYNSELRVAMLLFCGGLVILGLFFCGLRPAEVLKRYRQILRRTGILPCDFLEDYGSGPALFNCGVNGLVCVGIISAIGGDFSGPVLAGMLAVIGFSANGKQMGNISSLYIGMLLGAAALPGISMRDYSVQNGAMFVTACAPLVGHFGWSSGLLAGFMHCFVVRKTGGFGAGLNLYNNGLSAGLVCALLYPTLTFVQEVALRIRKREEVG